jgi:probable phosphoglycerate mutase
MTPLALIRHAPTAWNQQGLIQGRADIPLSQAGRAQLSGLRPPDPVRGFRWVTSPLGRAVETARLLGAEAPEAEPRLIEMDWGRWEGRTLADLRTELGEAMAANEDRGLDFRPEGGESPRDVRSRLLPWLAEVAGQGLPTVAVTHKGVIRVVMAMAFGWDMLGKPPVRLDWTCVHLFDLGPDGSPHAKEMNLPLQRSGAS